MGTNIEHFILNLLGMLLDLSLVFLKALSTEHNTDLLLLKKYAKWCDHGIGTMFELVLTKFFQVIFSPLRLIFI